MNPVIYSALAKGARAATMAIAVALLAPVFCSSGIAQAATIPVTFGITAGTLVFGMPGPTTLSLPTTVSGSGSFAPFGSAVYSEVGTITFVMQPFGFVPASVVNNFTASFNGGTNTFTGINSVLFGAPNAMGLPTFTSALTILSGTGIFSGATGFASATGMASPPTGPPGPDQVTPLSFSGGGQITAPGLTAVPEPGTIALLGSGMAGLAGLAAIRRKRRA